MSAKQTVWVVDDDSSIRWVLTRTLRADGFNVEDFGDAESALKALHKAQPDVLMTDIRMPGKSGLELAKSLEEQGADIPCIVMTAHTDLDSALASYESGAFEYLPKPFDLDDAVRLVNRAVESKTPLLETGDDVRVDDQIIGEAPAMQEVFRAIGRLAKSNINVMICGQSGTGKELVANALHRHSPRAMKPFVAINIAAIPGELLESELFGHEKGAFTGAQAQRQGRFEQANGGTLFLDEIGEMSAELQTRLLRVLSDRRFYRIGGRDLVSVDVRVLAATNRNLEEQVAQGHFREDLYHRLNVIRIDLPTLQERLEDIPLLSKRFLRSSAEELQVEMKQLSTPALQKMMSYHWPGNVRQLENICRWITVMAPARVVGEEDLPKEVLEASAITQPQDWEHALASSVRQRLNQGQKDVLDDYLKRFEAILLREALDHTGGHRQNAAKVLGWGRNTLTRKEQADSKIWTWGSVLAGSRLSSRCIIRAGWSPITGELVPYYCEFQIMKKNLVPFCAVCLLLCGSASAQMRYVTDDFEVMLRTGPSIQNKIVKPLRSGTRIEVLREDSGNGHSQVQTASGEIGYMLKRFISDQPSARNQLQSLETQLAQLRSEPNEIRRLLANSQDENRQLIEQNIELTDQAQAAKSELDEIKEISGDVIKLSSQNQKLESEVQQLLLQLDDIRIQNEALKDNSETIRNLLGVGVLLLGLFLGWVLSISGRRNRNSWGS